MLSGKFLKFIRNLPQMNLSASDKTYIKKHVREESLKKLSENLDVPEETVISYLKRKWSKEKLNTYLKSQSHQNTLNQAMQSTETQGEQTDGRSENLKNPENPPTICFF